MVFKATYHANERIGYIVTFSGAEVPFQEIEEGGKVEKPDDPTKEDSIFLGWYADPNFSQIFDFSSLITHDTVLYAKWTKKNATITWKNIDGTILQNTLVPYGEIPSYS